MAFVVLGMPRSRTAWLAKFLSHGGIECHHEHSRFLRSLDDVKSALAGPDGYSETAAAPFWRAIATLAPQTPVVIVTRPVAESVSSLLRAAPGMFDEDRLRLHLTRLSLKLEQAAKRMPNVIKVSAASLKYGGVLIKVFEHCHGRAPPPGWIEKWQHVNVQCNLPSLLRYMSANSPQLLKLTANLRQRMLTEFHSREQHEHEELTISVETNFKRFWADSRKQMQNHLAFAEMDIEPDHVRADILEKLHNIGCLQCVTARSNGVVRGYLMTIVSPSLEFPDTVEAQHIPFYGDPAYPGLGIRLQRFAADQLRDRGVSAIFMRAGVRASGPRLGTLYRRLGASSVGELFKLEL